MAAVIAVPVVLIACAVFATATIESQGAQHAAQQQTAGQMLMTAMLDQETARAVTFRRGTCASGALWCRADRLRSCPGAVPRPGRR